MYRPRTPQIYAEQSVGLAQYIARRSPRFTRNKLQGLRNVSPADPTDLRGTKRRAYVMYGPQTPQIYAEQSTGLVQYIARRFTQNKVQGLRNVWPETTGTSNPLRQSARSAGNKREPNPSASVCGVCGKQNGTKPSSAVCEIRGKQNGTGPAAGNTRFKITLLRQSTQAQSII